MSALTAFPTALAVASSAARPRAGAARASRAARARDVVRSDARLVASPSRRGVRCAVEKGGEAEKTVSALDAILAGSQDEPEPEPEVRDPAGYRRPDPSVAIHHLHHHPTPAPVRVRDVCPFLASRGPAAHPRPFLPYPPPPRGHAAHQEPAPKPDPNERKPGEVSEAMKARLRDEYVGLGGTPSKPMPSNLFLNIILGISALAVLCKLGGIL